MIKQSAKSFRASLFDFSFHSFVTPKIVQIVYVIAIVAAAVVAYLVYYVGSSLHSIVSSAGAAYGYGNAVGDGGTVLGLIVSPLVFISLVIVARVLLECTIALIRIAEHTDPLREHA